MGDVRHQAPFTLANVEGGGEAQASCTREHQNPGTALPRPLSPEVGSAEWVLGQYSLAELDFYMVITIRMIFDIGMFNTRPKTKAQLLAWKRCEITTTAEVEQVSRAEAKGIILQALGCGILNQETSHQEQEAMFEMAGRVSPLFASEYPPPDQVATPPGNTMPGP